MKTKSTYTTFMSKSYIQSEMVNKLEYDQQVSRILIELPLEIGLGIKKFQVFALYQQPLGKRIFSNSSYNIQLQTYRAGIRYLYTKLK